MKICELAKDLDFDTLPEDLMGADVRNIAIDPKKVKKGDLFMLLKDDDKSQFKMREALDNGAVAVIGASDYCMDKCYCVHNPRRAFALMEKRLHNCCCDKLKLIGVTGTNGKTTVTHLVYDILKGAGKKVGLIGTLGYKIGDEYVDTGFTTPDADMLHEIFEKMCEKGIQYVVIEVSAHALALEKLAGVMFDVAVLTNVTQDHLDFFGTMENYEHAKFKLFGINQAKRAVVCSDCVNMARFMLNCPLPTISYGVSAPSDVFAVNIKQSLSGTEFFCNCFDELMSVSTNLVGEYNVLNTLCAISVCSLLGIGLDIIKRELKLAPPIEGRFNVIEQNGKRVVIDFAHTPDGLEKAIQTVRDFTPGKIITVFGCGGERDVSKRPIMGKISSTLSDITILTNDNPRFEDPLEIIEDIQKGILEGQVLIIPDRGAAVWRALDEAGSQDTVLIAGKGGEKYQVVGDEKMDYDDFEQVYAYFRSKLKVIEGEDKIDNSY